MRSKDGKTWLVILVLVSLAGGLYATNPTVDKHRAAIARKIEKSANDPSPLTGAAKAVAAMAVEAGASSLTYRNYYLVSAMQDGDKWVSFGILGGVLVRTNE